MTLIGNFPATSSQKTQVSGSTVCTFDPIPFAVHSHDITNIGTAVGNSQRLLWGAADSRTTPQKIAFPAEPIANYVVGGRASSSRHFDVEQRTILLAAEDLGIAGAAVRHPAAYRELDRQCRVELDPKALWFHKHPDVAPQVSHLRQVLLRIKVKLPHSSQLSPS